MRRSLPLYLLFAGLLPVLAMGCANPADDAPDAVVQEAAPEPAPEPEAAAEATVYELSEDSKIGFVGAKVTGTHDGGFETFEGTVSVTDGTPEGSSVAVTIDTVPSKVSKPPSWEPVTFEGTVSVTGGTPEGSSVAVTIDTTSLWSDNERLTGHLKSADFFDVETYPTASFTSTEIAANEDGTYTLTGNLDLHGVTKQISFPANIEVSDSGFTATAEFSINRMDFEIVYPGKPDDLIRDDVLIKLDLKSAAAEAEGEGGEAEAAG